jgi:hypothetical protein
MVAVTTDKDVDSVQNGVKDLKRMCSFMKIREKEADRRSKRWHKRRSGEG